MERESNRPNPDELLEKINKESRGKLTVFLGAAAGVGKTFAMLQAAHDRLSEGINVEIGWIETHGRKETEQLVSGLPRIAPKILQYRGKELKEMDIEAILTKKPELVLVDELAHTNVFGSRHTRRFQDVEEILSAGINVYTTLNIQHIESLNDVVAQVTGVIVRETVPDYIIEQADNIRLIDIPPEDLIQRLKEGKVYIPGQAEQALKKFFRAGNINALRELALRFMASRVDQDMTEYMRSHQITGPWPTAGRVMVCVSASPFSAQLIRAARRLSEGLRAEFLAVHVDTSGRRFPMGEKEHDRIARNMRLAEDLGGKTITAVGIDIVHEILDIARSHNVTSIVVGKPRHSRLWEIMHGSLVDKLIRHSSGINVYVIQGAAEEDHGITIKTSVPSTTTISWLQVAGGLAMTAAITALSWLFKQQLSMVNIALLYLTPVLLTALWWGRWPSYITAITGIIIFDFLFVPPIFSFTVSDFHYLWSFIIFLGVSFLIGGRTEILRQNAQAARQREKSVRALYEFSRQIAALSNRHTIAHELAAYTGETIGRSTIVLLPDTNGKLTVMGTYLPDQPSGSSSEQAMPKSEYAVAVWAYDNGQVAGRSTETLPGGQYLFVPLMGGGASLGVFGINIAAKKITPEERRLISAWAGVAAISIERVRLSEAARQADLLAESEKLHTALFNSLSHELRTPLSTITGAVSTLLDKSVEYSKEIQHELLETVQEGAIRMERIVSNLLDIARLESGMLRLKTDWCDIEDIIGTALRRMGTATQKHIIQTNLSADLPLVKADFVLLEQVLVNLIDNAVKYSPAGSHIIISANQDKDAVTVKVQDNGPGIPQTDIDRIFDKFYRAKQTRRISGTGLGLSICKSIIEAHNGRIWVSSNIGGTELSFCIPI